DPLSSSLQDSRNDRRHRIAPKTEHYGNDGLAVQADPLEQPVDQHGETREISRILKDREGEEEGADDWEGERNSIRDSKRPNPVVADEKARYPGPRQQLLDVDGHPWVNLLAEKPVFKQVNQRFAAEN